ncbi:MAG TPA: helix-turn-helix domain-containing protein [Solirubrobacterales bacterium]|nr:helix-turn-helix domain-containing protein [Solirubrobacterales bacterium]
MTPSTVDVRRVAAVLEAMIRGIDRAEPFALAVDSATVGRRQLERSFRNLRTSPHRELCRIRVELAIGELTSKHGSFSHLEGVSRRVGYRDERRLREAVRNAYGLSPSEIRRGARIERNLKLDEQARAKRRGRRVTTGTWSSAYRRRRDREDLQRLLGKANAEGARVILGHIVFPRPAEAREDAADLAGNRALQLYAAASGELRRVA